MDLNTTIFHYFVFRSFSSFRGDALVFCIKMVQSNLMNRREQTWRCCCVMRKEAQSDASFSPHDDVDERLGPGSSDVPPHVHPTIVVVDDPAPHGELDDKGSNGRQSKDQEPNAHHEVRWGRSLARSHQEIIPIIPH